MARRTVIRLTPATVCPNTEVTFGDHYGLLSGCLPSTGETAKGVVLWPNRPPESTSRRIKDRNHLATFTTLTPPPFSLSAFLRCGHLPADSFSSSQFSHEFTKGHLLTPLTQGRIDSGPGNHWLGSIPFTVITLTKGRHDCAAVAVKR